jgi:DNA-binding NarL/FixJ family response regulator
MKVLIADDHPMVRDALSRTVHAIEPEAQILQAKDYAEIERNLQTPPDLVLVDLTMPGMDGVEGIRRLRAAYPSLRMVVASGDDDPATIRSVLATGVSGFLPKTEVADVLMHALKLVLSGATYTPVQALAGLCDAQATQRAGAGGLTARQTDVLRLLMQGEPNKVIARDLVMSEGRVKNVMAEIFRVLQVRNRTEAAFAARKMGILS